MNEWEERRREEIREVFVEDFFDNKFYDKILSQEKEMIREFAIEILNDEYRNDRIELINKILQSKGISEI